MVDGRQFHVRVLHICVDSIGPMVGFDFASPGELLFVEGAEGGEA